MQWLNRYKRQMGPKDLWIIGLPKDHTHVEFVEEAIIQPFVVLQRILNHNMLSLIFILDNGVNSKKGEETTTLTIA